MEVVWGAERLTKNVFIIRCEGVTSGIKAKIVVERTKATHWVVKSLSQRLRQFYF